MFSRLTHIGLEHQYLKKETTMLIIPFKLTITRRFLEKHF